MSPAELDRLLTHLDRVTTPAAAAPAAPVEDPVDWGKADDGTALTESDYQPQIARAIKAAHRVEKIEKENAALRESIEKDRQERQARRLLRDAHAIMAEHPDLFGDKPGQAEAGTPEAERYEVVMLRASRIAQQNGAANPATDIRQAMNIFLGGQAPAPKPPSRGTTPPGQDARVARTPPTVADYDAASLARPSRRRSEVVLSERERAIKAEVERRRENGRPVGTDLGLADDDDLPD